MNPGGGRRRGFCEGFDHSIRSRRPCSGGGFFGDMKLGLLRSPAGINPLATRTVPDLMGAVIGESIRLGRAIIRRPTLFAILGLCADSQSSLFYCTNQPACAEA